MKYNPKRKQFVIPADDLDTVYMHIMATLRRLRIIGDQPLEGYDSVGELQGHEYAAISVVSMAETLGLDLGVTPHDHNKLDLRDV